MAARRERWGQILSEAGACGMPILEYCRKQGLDERQFHHWRHILEMEWRKRKPKTPGPGFVLVRPTGEAGPETEASALELELRTLAGSSPSRRYSLRSLRDLGVSLPGRDGC